MPGELTFAQGRLLAYVAANPEASLYIENRESSSPHEGLTFHGYVYVNRCPTCGHAERKSVSWRVIFALHEGGFIKPTFGSYQASGITDLGRAALSTWATKYPRARPWSRSR